MTYDPDHPPNAAAWLALSAQERLAAVRAAHEDVGPWHPDPRGMHAGLHVTVENQIAAGEPAQVTRKVQELQELGLRRHAVIHAVAKVFLAQLAQNNASDRALDPAEYAAAVSRLDAAAVIGS